MSEQERKPVETPPEEVEVPLKVLEDTRYKPVTSSPGERDWLKWLKNLDFVYKVLFIMMFVVAADVIIAAAVPLPENRTTLIVPFFEVLKVVLYTATGYVFAKSKD